MTTESEIRDQVADTLLDVVSDLPPRPNLSQVDRAVIGYRRKLAGIDPWPTFEIPKSANAEIEELAA